MYQNSLVKIQRTPQRQGMAYEPRQQRDKAKPWTRSDKRAEAPSMPSYGRSWER